MENRANDFQIWLINQGYYRKKGSLLWLKKGIVVKGKELINKLNEYKLINK